MTPEQEIDRIKKDYEQQWGNLEHHPGVQRALSAKDPVRLGEILAMIVYGNYQDKGVATQCRKPITAYIDNQPIEFDTVESVKKYIASKQSTHPMLKIGVIFRRTDSGMEEVTI